MPTLDLYESRRDKFLECKYWSQINNPDVVKDSELAYNSAPSGTFFAKETNSYMFNSNVINNVFMVKQTTVSITTTDDVSDLQANDLIEFDNKRYRVEDIQKSSKNKQRQFASSGSSYIYYISLRG